MVLYDCYFPVCGIASSSSRCNIFFFFQAEDGIRDADVTGVQTCALPIWGVLGLTPTEDERVIRKAYLSLLPGVHPEEDPDGFRALREAYEFALESARQNDLLDGDDEPQATIRSEERRVGKECRSRR